MCITIIIKIIHLIFFNLVAPGVAILNLQLFLSLKQLLAYLHHFDCYRDKERRDKCVTAFYCNIFKVYSSNNIKAIETNCSYIFSLEALNLYYTKQY